MSSRGGTARYYLLYRDASRPGARAVGACRQVLDAAGEVTREEGIGPDGAWAPTETFRLQWLGKDDLDLVEVPEELAEAWVASFRASLPDAPGAGADG